MATYQGRTVKLNKPMKGDVKKFKVFVKDGDKVKKINRADCFMIAFETNKLRENFTVPLINNMRCNLRLCCSTMHPGHNVQFQFSCFNTVDNNFDTHLNLKICFASSKVS